MNAYNKATGRETVLELELSHLRTMRLADSPDIRIAVAEREQEVSAELERARSKKKPKTAEVGS